MKELENSYVLVLDTHRGIYFGLLEEYNAELKSVKLKDMQWVYHFYCIKEDDVNRGVYSLATKGPDEKSKIGPKVDCLINDVSKIVKVQESALENWGNAKWNM